MSEVIVRMEMPDRCPCELAIDNIGWFSPCFAYDGIPSREKEFDDCVEHGKCPSWCPIIGVLPEQHGRLVDADDANNHIMGYVDLRDCPTVVPAAKGERN